jgi:hypothetical protein
MISITCVFSPIYASPWVITSNLMSCTTLVPYDYLYVKCLRSSRILGSFGSSSILLKVNDIRVGRGKGYGERGIHVQNRWWEDV